MAADTHRLKGARFKPVLLELAGVLGDSRCADVTRRLREYRNRYAPILRLATTLVAPAVEEWQLFGDGDCVCVDGRTFDDRVQEDIAKVTITVTGNGAARSGAGSAVKRCRHGPLIGAPHAAVVAEKRITVVRRLNDREGPDALEKLERFMAYRFLPLAVLHNCRPDVALDDVPLVLRHYVHEATRTASFLVADVSARTAVIIDPQVDASRYEDDLASMQLRLVGIVLTHCFIDIAMGHATLLERHATAKLVSGTPWGSTGYGSCEEQSLFLSPRLHVKCISVPSFSPECLVAELHLDGQLLALFTGSTMGTDAVPRYEFFDSFPLPIGAQANVEQSNTVPTLEVARRFLKERIWDTYFSPDPAAGRVQPWDHVVVFPSHGGYSNVTHQLDLYWAVHIGDMKRMKHSRTVIGHLLDPEKYAQHVRERPPLPKPLLVPHVREWNLLSVPSAFGGAGRGILALRASSPLHSIPLLATVSPVVVDVRSAADHVTMHLKGSVNVPMTFPAEAYGVKKAELWLQCMLRPLQPVVVICANDQQRCLVRRRFELISPGAAVEAFTFKELNPPSEVPSVHKGRGRVQVIVVPCTVNSKCLPEQLSWVSDSAASAQLRLDCYQKLWLLEPEEGRLVLDCRTPYEFRNGSHNHGVFLSLGDLCHMTAMDSLEHSSMPGASTCSYGWPSSNLGPAILDRLHEAALASGLDCRPRCEGIRMIVVYCATGYRSLIAASLLRRAFEVTTVDITVCDVAGGALQLMQQRPDLWTVKDRSIICIS